MHTQTHDDYIKLAHYFLSRYVEGRIDDKDGALSIQRALIECAPQYRPAYWRRLRCALVYAFNHLNQPEAAAVIKAAINPVTSGGQSATKPKQKRIKKVSKKQHDLIRSVLLNKKNVKPMDECLLAALEIVSILGCRPAEILRLKLKPNSNQVLIPSAKKTSNQLRGLDRTVILSHQDYHLLANAQGILTKHRESLGLSKATLQSRLQGKLARLTKKLWPNQKHRISFYSYRHQMGSDLKGSGESRKQIAAIMGHQSVKSVDAYGDKRCSGGLKVRVLKATQQTVERVRTPVSYRAPFWSKPIRDKPIFRR